MNVTDSEPLEQIRPVFDLDFVPKVRSDDQGQNKIKVIGLLIVAIILLLCIACCIIAYYYHKSAGELLEQHDDVEGRKPLSQEDQTPHKDETESDEESDGIDEAKFGSLQMN